MKQTIAEQLALVGERPEVFEVQWVPVQQAFDWVLDGTISDSKTVVALTRALHRQWSTA